MRKAKLCSELTDLAKENPEADAAMANEDMKDYLNSLASRSMRSNVQ